MLDEERVERDPVLRVEHLAQRRFGLLGGPGPHDAEPVRDAVDVRVDRDRRDPVAEDEDAVRRLRADPGQRRQRLEAARDLPVEPVEHRRGAGPDHAGFDPVEAGRPDQRLEVGRTRPGERRGVGVAREEARARDVGVRVARPLREDRADQHLERVLGVVAQVRRAPVPGPVELREPVEDLFPLPGGEAGGRRHPPPPGGERALGRPEGSAGPGSAVSRPGSERSGSSSPFFARRSSPTR